MISKFQSLEELILSYDWDADYYYDFDENDSLSNAINSIKTLKKVIFRNNDYLLKTLSKIKFENACFINDRFHDAQIKYIKYIIHTEMLNNIKNIEIKIDNLNENFSYKDKILKFVIDEAHIDDFFNYNCDNMPGLKNIEQLFIKIRYYDKNQYYYDKKDYSKIISNLILYTCKQNNHLKKIYINYINCDLNEILKILNAYYNSNDTLKNIELFGKVEPSHINTILDYIFKIKNKKVDININILDENIREIICNNVYIKKGNLSFEKINMEIHSTKDKKINLLKIKQKPNQRNHFKFTPLLLLIIFYHPLLIIGIWDWVLGFMHIANI